MFKKSLRLPANIRIANTTSVATPLFILRATKNQLAHNRYGLVVSKKVDKRAVFRNRARRQISSQLEALHNVMQQGNDVLFLVRQDIVGKKTEDVLDSLTYALKKAHLL
jgi:ribonuclease P protein component